MKDGSAVEIAVLVGWTEGDTVGTSEGLTDSGVLVGLCEVAVLGAGRLVGCPVKQQERFISLY